MSDESRIADLINVIKQRAYQDGFQAGRESMKEDAAGVAKSGAWSNMTSVKDQIAEAIRKLK